LGRQGGGGLITEENLRDTQFEKPTRKGKGGEAAILSSGARKKKILGAEKKKYQKPFLSEGGRGGKGGFAETEQPY